MKLLAIPVIIFLLLFIGFFILLIRKVKFDKVDDKAKHVYSGIVLNLISSCILYFGFNYTIGLSVLLGFLIGGPLAGFVKEIVLDKLFRLGSCTIQDFVFTCWGSLCGIVLSLGILNSF